jgi:hypothetical protein
MPKITPRDTLCTDITRVGTVPTDISRKGVQGFQEFSGRHGFRSTRMYPGLVIIKTSTSPP